MDSVTSSDWKRLKVQELRDVLASRGLDTSGVKASLIQRLETSSKANNAESGSFSKEPEEQKQEPSLKSVSKENIILSIKDNVDSENSLPAIPVPETTRLIATGPKGLTSSETVDKSNFSASLSFLEKKRLRAERFKVGLHTSEEEKRSLRAARFGGLEGSKSIVTEEAKKEARLARFGLASYANVGQSVEREKKKARAIRFGLNDSDQNHKKV
ncbi:hypothetical protein O6H91_17G019800 [Diphasiastrum complanatum]|uniref:Uncharacterized protein n=2 Tax=Diphasiastrum complanatum TaxID=34168 RepID=A0ACC2B4S8_DIPCM|nr:hypothetical protein O6H91_Y179500 [Diphasiastrum complanatum]KAJ7524760.1 hypothetical protein O6H91_17G019800 [Diphasiastrum complanatum]